LDESRKSFNFNGVVVGNIVVRGISFDAEQLRNKARTSGGFRLLLVFAIFTFSPEI
jgi:hypothetical protein